MSNNKPLFTKETFKLQPIEFRIGAIFSDGMWYTKEKIEKYTKASYDEITEWIDQAVKDGVVIPASDGSKSYRMSYDSLVKWMKENRIEMGSQIISDIFPSRVWDKKTETEGFIDAPLRELGVVSFQASPEALKVIQERLKGIAKIRSQEIPGKYKAFCLSSTYIAPIIKSTLAELGEGKAKTYARAITMRRELVDFSTAFSHGIIDFYSKFGKTLVRKEMDTIKIFLPEPEDQDSQIMTWVIDAIEKFNQDAPVPFSGYLHSVLSKRPYDLPVIYLGKELAEFQKNRSRKIKEMRKQQGKPDDHVVSNEEVARAMGLPIIEFKDLEEQHKMWVETRKNTPLTWDESSEEKMVESSIYGGPVFSHESDDILASNISHAIIKTALMTSRYDEAIKMIKQMGTSDIDMNSIRTISPEFIESLGRHMGVDDQ